MLIVSMEIFFFHTGAQVQSIFELSCLIGLLNMIVLCLIQSNATFLSLDSKKNEREHKENERYDTRDKKQREEERERDKGKHVIEFFWSCLFIL